MIKMKNFITTCFYSVLCLFLFACTQGESQKTATAVPATAIVASSTIDTAPATMTPSLPPFAFNPTPIIETPLPQTPSPNQLPDFEPTQIPGLLKSALTIETLSGFNGHNLQRVNGWKYGFYSLEWLDTNHLMLYPYAGVTGMADTTIAGTYPAVVNLNSKKFWIPYLTHAIVNERASFSWSAQLGVLIVPGSNNEVNVYGPDGDLKNSYLGSLLGVSPSATKILIDDGTWIDLSNGKTVDFAWHQTYPATDFAAYAYSHHFRPIWSPDEMRVYTCCYMYGDARTGASLVMPYDGITIDGKKANGLFEVLGGIWVLNDKYMMPIWQGYWDSQLSTVFLFDPSAKTYRNLSKIAGLPDYLGDGPEPYCNRPSAQNGGRYVWVDCKDGGHLIDLVTFHSQTYPLFSMDAGWPNSFVIEWSADGQFAWMSGNGIVKILSVNSDELKPLPKDCYDLSWRSKDNVFACLSIDGQSLLLIDAETASVQEELALPIEFQEVIWSPDGRHIALLARDSSLWQVDYPILENLEQLTAAGPEWTHLRYSTTIDESLIKNVLWSPDGMSLAFIGGVDVYVVDTAINP
jgi:hypothetical protein